MKKITVLISATFCASVAISCASAQHAALDSEATESTAISPAVAVATFDSLWTVVQQTYVDTSFVAGKWKQVRNSLRPRASTVTNRAQLSKLLASTLAEIPDSHFYIIPATIASDVKSDDSASGGGTTGMSVRIVGNDALVWRVEPGSPADRAGIHAGETVETVGDRVARPLLQKVMSLDEKSRQRAFSELEFKLNRPLSPAPGETVRVTLVKNGATKPTEVTLTSVPAHGTISKFGNLPPITGVVHVERKSIAPNGGCVGVIGFNIWLPALVPEIERGLESVGDCAGIVIDLRGNPGGVGAMVMGFGGFFVASPVSLGTMRTRDLLLNFAMNPRRLRINGSDDGPFRGPVAILVDPMSASTSEIFAAGMQRIHRARVFGDRSAAAALPALMQALPSGDVFVHAVADFRDPEGGRIEGAGVTPDEIVPLTRADLSKNIDAPLEAAIRWISSNPKGK